MFILQFALLPEGFNVWMDKLSQLSCSDIAPHHAAYYKTIVSSKLQATLKIVSVRHRGINGSHYISCDDGYGLGTEDHQGIRSYVANLVASCLTKGLSAVEQCVPSEGTFFKHYAPLSCVAHTHVASLAIGETKYEKVLYHDTMTRSVIIAALHYLHVYLTCLGSHTNC